MTQTREDIENVVHIARIGGLFLTKKETCMSVTDATDLVKVFHKRLLSIIQGLEDFKLESRDNREQILFEKNLEKLKEALNTSHRRMDRLMDFINCGECDCHE